MIFTFSIVFLFFTSEVILSQENKAIAMCGVNPPITGRCTGSAYCTACKNCKYCKYCNSGGVCGVCSSIATQKRNNYKNYSSNTFVLSEKNNSPMFIADNPSSQYYLKTLVVNANVLNLRIGPGKTYQVIHKLNRNQELIFLGMKGDWIKVKVNSNLMIGYIHYNYILVID